MQIVGLRFGGFRVNHPVSQAVFSGATVNGSSTVTGGVSPIGQFTEEILFDSPVTSFTVSGTTDNYNAQFLIGGLVLAVPEPASLALLGLGGLTMLSRHTRRH